MTSETTSSDDSRAITANAPNSVTFVVQHRVRPEVFARYEAWLKRIVTVASTYPGYQGVDIIRPVTGDNEYVTIVRFTTYADANRWCRSDDRSRMLAEIADILADSDRARIEGGIDFWFTPAAPRIRHAPAWKQWLVTTSVIWPLSMIIPPLFAPLLERVSWLGAWGIREGIVAAVIVAVVVFVVMPRYVRAVGGWLYKE